MIQNKETHTYALWLPSWYPNNVTPYAGDFIKRHAEAVAIYQQVVVVHVQKADSRLSPAPSGEVKQVEGKPTEIIVYYQPLETGIQILDKLFSFLSYRQLYRKYLTALIAAHGKPSVVHVHVAHKVAGIALWVKRKYGLPVIISEHWSGYLSKARTGLKRLSGWEQSVLKKLYQKAAAVTTVSNYLGRALIEQMNIRAFQVIPNVVNTTIFRPIHKNPNPVACFIHVSGGGEEKNIQQIMAAFQKVKANGIAFEAVFVVSNQGAVQSLVLEMDLTENIRVLGEMPQTNLVKHMQEADALVLYSQYETFGCVVIEANACGIPAIVSDLPTFREYCIENQTALFAGVNDSNMLASQMMYLIENKDSIDRQTMAERTRQRFSYETVGQQFKELYTKISS